MNFLEFLIEHALPFLAGALVGLLLIGVAVVLVRTLRFRPKKTVARTPEAVEVDTDAAVAALAALVRCKTVSYRDSALEDNAEFEKLVALLPELYPNVMQKATLSRFEGRALLLHWQGKSADEPAVLMAHYDVVPADERYWDKPPFDAVLEDGVLWGRGTLDTKVTMNAALFAANRLIGEGFVPEHDVYFAF